MEEYYLYDPERGHLEGWIRVGSELRAIDNMNSWVSPRLKIRFEVVEGFLLRDEGAGPGWRHVEQQGAAGVEREGGAGRLFDFQVGDGLGEGDGEGLGDGEGDGLGLAEGDGLGDGLGDGEGVLPTPSRSDIGLAPAALASALRPQLSSSVRRLL